MVRRRVGAVGAGRCDLSSTATGISQHADSVTHGHPPTTPPCAPAPAAWHPVAWPATWTPRTCHRATRSSSSAAMAAGCGTWKAARSSTSCAAGGPTCWASDLSTNQSVRFPCRWPQLRPRRL